MKKILSSLFAAALLIGAALPSSAAQAVVKLNAVGASQESGRAVLTDVPGIKPSVRVSITVAGEPAGAIQPSHIHKGTCGSNGPIDKPLHSVVSGKSVTVISGVTVAQLIAAPTYINIHKSPTMLTVIVSCGKI